MPNSLIDKFLWYLQGKHKRPFTLNDGKKKTKYFGKPISTDKEGNSLIYQKLINGGPFMVSRLGATELRYLFYYLKQQYEQKGQVKWNIENKTSITLESGFFPVDDQNLNKFCDLYLHELPNIDVLGVWFKPGEDFLVNKYCFSADLVPLSSLEPYFHQPPWSRALLGKKVLVIHPFEQTIKKQFLRKDQLFRDPLVHPEYELITLKSVQSMVPDLIDFDSWFDALDSMKDKIDSIDFDIAIVGAGAYGLPLAAHIKKLGKHAIHMGGAAQLFFGIRGNRWDRKPRFHSFFNEHWTWPSEEEKPPGDQLVDDFAYWKK